MKESSSKIQRPLSSINSLSKEERGTKGKNKEPSFDNNMSISPASNKCSKKGSEACPSFLSSFNAFPYTYVVYGTVVNRILC